jgi:acyl-coenzyme A thioesterase PaaI-like protein
MDGHLYTAHGGVAATLLDEAMGNVGGIHKTPGRSIFTAFMHVNYKKPAAHAQYSDDQGEARSEISRAKVIRQSDP